jgi:GntR family transcriptional regulator
MLVDRPRPITEQVTDIIRNRIREGTYDQVGRLPSETELGMSLNVSRATVRTALTVLAAEGFIVRRQGDGTYINKHAIEVLSQSKWEFTRLIEESGRKPSITTLVKDQRPATEHESSILGIKRGDEVIAVERVFNADGLPVIISNNILSKALIRLPYPDNAWDESILDFLKKYCAEYSSYNIVDISAIEADSKIAKILGLKRGLPIIQLNEIFYNRKSRPLFCATNYYNDRIIRMRFTQLNT